MNPRWASPTISIAERRSAREPGTEEGRLISVRSPPPAPGRLAVGLVDRVAASPRATLATIVDPAPAVQAYRESFAAPVFESIAELLTHVGVEELL